MEKKVADSVQIKFSLSLEEARAACSHFGISGPIDAEDVAEQLADEIKTWKDITSQVKVEAAE